MSNYETIQRQRNLTVGIFVVIALCALVWLIYRFGDLPIYAGKLSSYNVTVQFPTAPGVQQDTPVKFCGYQVGRVIEVKPPRVLTNLDTGQSYHQMLVIMAINKKYQNIPVDVNVKLVTRGLGSSYIELFVTRTISDPNASEEYLQGGMVLQGGMQTASEFFPVETQRKLEGLLTGISELVQNANDIIGDQANKQNLNKLLENTSQASANAAEALKEFRDFSTKGREAVVNADERSKEVFASIVNLSDELAKTATQLRVTLETMNEGQGTVSRMLNDASLYENLLENTQSMNDVLKQIELFIEQARDKGVPIKLK